jgi:probable addiction module antidote protein
VTRKPVETIPWDPSERLVSDEAAAGYLAAALEDGDPCVITAVLGDIARARGMSHIAREAGLTRAGLYKALRADGNPEFATVLAVIKGLGLKLSSLPADR